MSPQNKLNCHLDLLSNAAAKILQYGSSANLSFKTTSAILSQLFGLFLKL